SSRRRHTRLVSDWSSDVCSSDLTLDDIKSPERNTKMTNLYNEDNFDKKERMKQDQLIHQTRNLDILPPADVAKVKATLRRSMTRSEERRVGKECRSRGSP